MLQIGKTPIVVNDSRGFYTSRTFGTFVHEGCSMLAEGIPAAVIENAGRLAGMPVGPLAVIDETSMSLSVHVMEQTRADLEAEGKKYAPQPGQEVIVRMVKEFKRPGRAGGGGFYEYPKDGKKFLWPELAKIFGKKNAKWDFEELKERILYRQAIETARCLEEGVLEHVHDGNIGSIFGIGFPGLDRRRAAVREPRRREEVRQARRGTGEESRPALRAAQAAARPRREEQAARLMSLPPILQHLRLPVIAAPMFIAGNPKLVIEQCKAGIVGSFPALNARPEGSARRLAHRDRDRARGQCPTPRPTR